MFYSSHAMLGSAIILGLATAAWGKIKQILARAASLFIVSASVQGGAAAAVQAKCWSEFRRSPFGSRRYESCQSWVRPLARFQVVGFEKLGTDPVLFWNGLRPILLSVESSTDDAGGQSSQEGRLQITFIRGTWKLDELLVVALDRYNDTFSVARSSNRRFSVRRIFGSLSRQKAGSGNGGKGGSQRSSAGASSATTTAIESGEIRPLRWRSDELGSPLPLDHHAIDALALPTAAQEMVHELRRWKDSEDWYRKRKIPWTRGWLLFGAPGTGKTSLIRAIAQDFDLPIFIFDLASLNNRELQENWELMQQSAPCIALMEDLDTVFRKRINCSGDQGGGLTFDALLNCLSGIESADGVFKVATTNNIDELDSALGVPSIGDSQSTISTRPGRFDRALELPALDDSGRRKIAAGILGECPWCIGDIVIAGKGDTGAQFVERCSQIALAEHWQASLSSTSDNGVDSALKLHHLPVENMSHVA
jgi:hypothetical protein